MKIATVRQAFGRTQFNLRTGGIAVMIALTLSAGNLAFATTVATLSGSGSAGYTNGPTTAAAFHTPVGLALDEDDNILFVADQSNNAVRALLLDDNSTITFVPNTLVPTNLLNRPVEVALDSDDNVYVLNRGNGTNGTVLEFDIYGYLLATNATKLTNAAAIALDPIGNVYVTVKSNTLIRISGSPFPTNVTVVATVTNAGASLQGIVVKQNGLIAACDSGRSGILLINPSSGLVTTNAGFNGPGDNTNSISQVKGTPAALANFNQPHGVAEAGDGSLIITDYGNNKVKVVNAAGVVTNLYGISSNYWGKTFPGFQNGTVAVPDAVGGVAARQPNGIVFASDGTVYVTEDYYDLVRQVTGTGLPLPIPPPPAAPTILTVTTNFGQVSLTWSAVATATGYNVERATSSGGPYTIIASLTGTSYTDTNVLNGTTYYYVVSAVNGGSNGANSLEVSATPPIPPPPAPTIGWFDFEPNSLNNNVSVLHPVSGSNAFIANNDVNIGIESDAAGPGLATYYIAGLAPLSGFPSSTNGSTPPPYQDGLFPDSPGAQPLLVTTVPDLVIEAVNVGPGGSSPVATAEFLFQVGNPTITGNNGAQFTVSDVTTNANFYYTTDGSTPTNDGSGTAIGPITNNPVTISLNISTNVIFTVRAFRSGYSPSGPAVQSFLTNDFAPNTISFGFASGPGSSHYVASPGQSFFVPVSLSLLSSTPPIYGLQFNLTLTNLGSSVVDPGTINFESLIGKPDPTDDGYFLPIPPYEFISDSQPNNDPNAFQYQGDWYQSLEFADTNNDDLLGVGWLEVFGRTNLYVTTSQNLLTFPIVDGTDPSANPNQMVIGSYTFGIPPNASPGDVYQIQIGRPSATTFSGLSVNPYGTPVVFEAPANTNLLGPGSASALKNVTIGQIKYLVGDVYPANWYNAGDFGSSNLVNVDAIRVFDFAAYPIAQPPAASDLFDALDSCGNIGVFDSATGYYTNTAAYPYPTNYPNAIVDYTDTYDTNGVRIGHVPGYTADFSSLIYLTTYFVSVPYTITNIDLATPPAAPTTNTVQTNYVINVPPGNSTLFNYNDTITNINQIAFGDGVLDVCDVYVTFRRSLDSSLTWFNRFWTNGARVAQTTANEFNSGVLAKSLVVSKTINRTVISAVSSASSSTSITNQPLVNFFGTDIQTSAGSVVNIPITGQVFGNYPLRVLMLNLSVVPLDGSPPLTTPISFSPGAVLGQPTSGFTISSGNGNYAAAWLDSTIAGISSSATIGTLTVTIPTNATSMSAYAVHFDHASASPTGFSPFPKQTLTALITLSARTSSTYNDAIPDSWRLRWFGTIYNLLSASNACPSGDGISNWKKYIAGVDPNRPNDFPSVNPNTPPPSGAAMSIYWPTVSGKQYAILSSSSLFPGNWTTNTVVTGNGANILYNDSSAGTVKFYRVLILP